MMRFRARKSLFGVSMAKINVCSTSYAQVLNVVVVHNEAEEDDRVDNVVSVTTSVEDDVTVERVTIVTSPEVCSKIENGYEFCELFHLACIIPCMFSEGTCSQYNYGRYLTGSPMFVTVKC